MNLAIPFGRLRNFERSGFIFWFALPTLLLLAVVLFYPIIYAIDTSLHETQFLEQLRFVGLQNYVDLLGDASVQRAIWTSITYTATCVLITVPFGLGLALLLNRPLAFERTFLGVLVTPWAVSQTVVALLWAWLLNPSYGPVDAMLQSVGQEKLYFLSDPSLAWYMVVLAIVWHTYPYPMIMFLAALKTVPKDLYEAIAIDGGGPWIAFWYVTLPFLRTTILSTAILLSLLFLNMVTMIFIMTGGGPLHATETLAVRVFKDGFIFLRTGVASTLSVLIVLLNLGFSVAYVTLLKSRQGSVA